MTAHRVLVEVNPRYTGVGGGARTRDGDSAVFAATSRLTPAG